MPIWVLVAAGLLLLRVLRWALLPFVLGAVVAFVSDPLIRRLQRASRAPRWLVASGLFLVLLAVGCALAVGAGLSAWRDLARIQGAGLEPLRQTLFGLLGPHGRDLFGVHFTADGVLADVKGKLGDLARPSALRRLVPAAFGAAVGLVILALASFYLMVSGPKLAEGALRLAPPRWRSAIMAVAPDAVRIVQRYFIGVLCVVVFTALAAWVGYGLVLHVRGAPMLALAVGVLETVPLIGPALAACLIALAASQLKSAAAVLGMIAYALALRLIVDDVVAPVVLGRSVTVHPVVVMFAYVVGACLFGVIGLVLAVPAAAILRVVATRAYGETEREADRA